MTVTLTEKATLSSPVYLFRFVNKITLQENTCIAADASNYSYRFNRFSIEENSTEDRTAGVLSLPVKGEWTYYVYEQESSGNLDPAKASGVVETGCCKVTGAAGSVKRHTPDKTWKVYE